MAAVVTRRPGLRLLTVSDVSPVAIAGGGERVLWEQSSRLARVGHRVRIVSRGPADDRRVEVERDGVAIRQFPVDRRSLLRFLRSSILGARRAAAVELARAGADVLHLHQPLSGYGVLRLPAARRIPILYTFLSPAPLEYRSRRGTTGLHRAGLAGRAAVGFLWLVERACLRAASRIHVLSAFSAAQLRTLYRIAPARVVRIPGGVDTGRFRPASDRTAVRAALGIPTGRPVLLTVRNLEPRMGLDALLRAVAILREEVPDLLLLVGGTGGLRAELASQAAALGLGGCVRFLGFVPEAELAAYYQAADFFVLPTRELEGFGLVTVESLACGTPVLGTPVGAIPEVLEAIGPEYVFDGMDAGAIARGTRKHLARLADREGYEALRRACAETAVTRFGWDRVVERLERELLDLATPPAGRPVR